MSLNFKISPVNTALTSALQDSINQKSATAGVLGQKEALALKLGLIQNTLKPRLHNPTILVFAGDHGVNADVNATTQRVTQFLDAMTSKNGFAKKNGIEWVLIDAGVNSDLGDHPYLLSCKIAKGTQNFLVSPAMTPDQCIHAIKTGSRMALQQYMKGCNCLGFGEIGVGNSLSAALLMHCLTELPLEQCIELTIETSHEPFLSVETLKLALSTHPDINTLDPLAILATFGGFELAMQVGALLRAAELGLLLIVDSFAASCALLVASTLYPEVLAYSVFSHVSDELSHRRLLKKLAVEPLLDLQLRQDQGSGIVLAYPLLKSAALLLNPEAAGLEP